MEDYSQRDSFRQMPQISEDGKHTQKKLDLDLKFQSVLHFVLGAFSAGFFIISFIYSDGFFYSEAHQISSYFEYGSALLSALCGYMVYQSRMSCGPQAVSLILTLVFTVSAVVATYFYYIGVRDMPSTEQSGIAGFIEVIWILISSIFKIIVLIFLIPLEKDILLAQRYFRQYA